MGAPDSLHLEKTRGTHEQARDYAYKPGDPTFISGPYIFGDETGCGQGTRSDLITIKVRIDSGHSEEEIASEFFSDWVRYYKGLREYKKIKTKPRSTKTLVTFIYGPPGSGKSHCARQMDLSAFWCGADKWFDGYSNQRTVVLDEFHGNMPWNLLLRLMDEYPLQVEFKGGHYEFTSDRLIITSMSMPHHWYKDSKILQNIDSFWRRVDQIIYFPIERGQGLNRIDIDPRAEYLLEDFSILRGDKYFIKLVNDEDNKNVKN